MESRYEIAGDFIINNALVTTVAPTDIGLRIHLQQFLQ
jgi:hypothetical protein